MAVSQYLGYEFLNWLRNDAMPVPLANLYISLHTADPGRNGINSDITATIAPQRAQISAGNLSAPATAPGPAVGFDISNIPEVVFTLSATATGTLTHWGAWDSLSGGNFVLYAPLTPVVPIQIGDIVRFAPGQLVCRIR